MPPKPVQWDEGRTTTGSVTERHDWARAHATRLKASATRPSDREGILERNRQTMGVPHSDFHLLSAARLHSARGTAR